ncbi:MAG: GtrA family protein [archaeon]|nr:GtrA family protein [archaeon]
MRENFEEFLKFCIVGVASTILNYAVFFTALYLFKVDPVLSFFLGYIAGFLFSFKFNKHFTFKSTGKHLPEISKYVAIYAFSLFLGLSLFNFLAVFLKTEPTIGFILTISLTTLTNYLGSKKLAFKSLGIHKTFYSRLFLAVLLIKILFLVFFASDFLVKGTVPFVYYFVSSGFSNPYEHFLNLGELKAFPYSTAMLLSVAFPVFLFSFLPQTITQNVSFQVLVTRLPLLIADIGIFYILLKLLKTKEKEVLIYYWCSPIVLYISYFHGQLDAIPIFFLIAAVYLLLTERHMLSALTLGLALGAKANIFVSVPFIFIYLHRNQEPLGKILKYFFVSILVYLAFVLPYVFSEGYQKLVLQAEEQFWIFLLQIQVGATGIVLYLVPIALTVFFLRLTYFRKINQDALLMSLAGSFMIIIALAPPRPGWFFWAIPFLAYFFARDEYVSKTNYLLLNIFFLLYFLVFGKNADIFQSLSPLNPALSAYPNIYTQLSAMGFNADLISNSFYAAFVGVIIANFYFIYKFGLLANLKYRKGSLMIGIGGDSGAGKTYTNKIIEDLVGLKNLTRLEGDDLHKWERGNPKWGILTHLNPKANLLHKEIEYLKGITESKKLKRKEYDHSTGKFTPEKTIMPKKFILVSGLHSFYLSGMRKLLDIKIFLNPDDTLKKYWKIKRDVQERGYSEEKAIQMLASRGKDSKKYLEPQIRFADIVFTFRPLEKIDGIKNGEIKKELLVLVDNSFDPHRLMDGLSKFRTLNSSMEYNDDLATLTLRFDGKISPQEIARIAYDVIPNLEEALENRSPKWRDNLEGIMQLIILHYISENLKTKAGSEEL